MSKQILIVDDDAMNRIMLGRMLREDYDILEAVNGREALEVIHRNHETLSAVLLDIVMPEMDGYETLRRMRDNVESSDIPVIMVTGMEDEASRSKALTLGANDFVLKPYNPDIIKHCIKNNIAFREVSATVSVLERDRLTGIWSREAFFRRAAAEVEKMPAGYYVLGCVDIEGFKVINDQYGSETGDRILKCIADTLQQFCSEKGGLCGHLFADQFVSLFPQSLLDTGTVGPDRLEARILETSGIDVTISVGRYHVEDKSLSVAAMFDRASIAKSTIKGRYDAHIAQYDEGMRDQLVHERAIVNEMKAALAEGQFEVWLQPQYNHATSAMIGAEALVRWRHPSMGLIPPMDFIPIFEQNGFIYAMDRFVWEKVCACLRRWLDEGRSPLPVSVNISRYDVLRPDVVEVLAGLVEKYELPIDLLRLEITESVFSEASQHIVEVVKELLRRGFTVEIDDFGTGYSSLNTLKDVPAQIIKLDMKFLESSDDSQRGGNIVESVVRMAKWLGMSVIAEGVETIEQADYLRSIGCNYMQGYLFARPMPVGRYEEHCGSVLKEERLLTLETVENLDNNAFWDHRSMDTLIFSSYVGAACIFEYCNHSIELLRINRKFTAILGDGTISAEDTLKLDWISCLTPECRELVRTVLLRSCETRDEYTDEYIFLNIPGAPPKTYLRTTLRVIAIAGERMLVYCTCENITAQRVAEENQRQSEEALNGMMRDMPGGLVRVLVHPDGGITPVYYNEGFVKLTGMSGGELLKLYGGDVMAGVHPDDAASVRKIASGLLVGGEAHSSRYRLRHGSGGYFWVSTFERASRDESGRLFINIYFADATKQIEQEELQKSLMDNLPCGAGIYEFKDGQMSLTYQNKIYWELVGLGEEAYPDPSEMSAVHPDDIPIIMRELSSAIEQRRDVRCEIRLRHLTRGYRPVHLLGRIVFREDGSFMIYATFTPAEHEGVSYQQMLPLLLSAMMESTADMFFAKDESCRYISASRAFANMAGKSGVDEIIGKTDMEIFDSDFARKFREDDEALLRGGQSIVDMVEPIPSQDGTPHYSCTSKYLLRDGEGKKIGIFGVGRDMTEARTTASRLELVTNNLPGGIASYEAAPDAPDDMRISYFSDGLCRLFGYSREEYARLMDEDPYVLVHEEDIPRLHGEISALVSEGRPVDCVYRARASDGAYKWVNIKAVMGEPDGEKITVNAVSFDVTEQKEALEKLRMSEEVNRLAIQQSMGMVCRYDVATRQLTVPENVDSIFEAETVEADIPYKPVREGRVSPETADAYISFYESILRGEKKGISRFQRTSTQGWRWVEAHFSTIFADSGEPATAVISIFDVTESIEKEAAYKKWKQSIRDKKPDSYSLYRCNITKSTVLETSEGLLLPQDQLENSLNLVKRTANYADVCVLKEDRPRYLSFMNRDAMLLRYSQGRRTDTIEYREIVQGGGYRWLRLSVDFVDSPYSSEVEAFLLFEDIDEAKREELAILDRAEKDQLTGVLNRSNFAARVERKLTERKQDAFAALFIIDLDGFKQVNDFFGHAVGDETLIEIGQKLRDTFRSDDLVCRLGGDEFMVYMGSVSYLGTVKERAALLCALLHKSFSLEVQLSASIGISVCPDNGDDFESLYRKADAALYHVKGLGKDGYAFYEESMTERERLPENVAIEKAKPTGAVYMKPKLRMLIVDDNEINRDYLTSLFEDEYLIDTAAEGTAALIRLNRYGAGISVVLLDLMMPGMDGFAVLKKMRESVTMQSIPVIVVSGMNEREACLEAIKAGASDYITKPVDAELLKLRVASVITKTENEQLRAQNRYLALQNEEAKRLAEARAHSEELSVALHAAEKADLAKSQFLSSMSHEIRTPLNAVIGYNTIARSEMSEAKTDDERKQVSMKVLDCLTKSEVASRHLLTIINDVLDMSAIESGKLKVEGSPFDFRGLITSLTVMFFSQARAKGVDFEVLFDKPTEEWFIGDQLRINQVLTNLLSNAVKFTPEGGSVTLTITENRIDSDSTGFCFVVADTGIGMTQEYLGHIWTPFEQAEASISRRFGGSGLGLSITKNLVDLMGGAIAVESRSGVGSKFTVNLTLKRTEQPAKTPGVDFSKIYALVVDDDVNTCDYIKRLFDRCGAECVTFTSGRQGVAAFAEAKRRGRPFSVCLVDWRMPQMDGFTTISEIRRIASKDLPIVVVTAYDFDEIAEYAETLGINRFISKPLFQSSLFDLLATICGQQSTHSAESVPKLDFDGARVLLVEDNNMNMEVAKHVLVSAKLAVDCAWNGQEAFDIFLASKPGTYKAVLMDVHMPVIDGYQATRMIRSTDRPDAKTVPIIAMTADVFAEDIEQAHNAGMNDHIAKPIDVEAMFKTLGAYMEDTGK